MDAMTELDLDAIALRDEEVLGLVQQHHEIVLELVAEVRRLRDKVLTEQAKRAVAISADPIFVRTMQELDEVTAEVRRLRDALRATLAALEAMEAIQRMKDSQP